MNNNKILYHFMLSVCMKIWIAFILLCINTCEIPKPVTRWIAMYHFLPLSIKIVILLSKLRQQKRCLCKRFSTTLNECFCIKSFISQWCRMHNIYYWNLNSTVYFQTLHTRNFYIMLQLNPSLNLFTLNLSTRHS